MEKTKQVSTLTAEQRLIKARLALMRDKRFILFSGVMTIGSCYVTDDPSMPTACTNGRDEWYNRKFVEFMGNKELAFVVLHETLHKIYRHPEMYSDKTAAFNQELMNIACDYLINLEAVSYDPKSQVIAMPKSALYDTRFANMSSYQIYQILKKQALKGGGGGKTLDEHTWDKFEKLSEEEKVEVKTQIENALREGKLAAQKIASNDSSSLSLSIDDLLAPKVDWREELRETAKRHVRGTDESSWARPNRRMLAHGFIMPSMIKTVIESIVFAVDTSGSISKDFLTQFMSEVSGLIKELKPEQVHILYWDSSVASHEVYTCDTADNIVQSTRPKGGGGTSPSCVLEFFKEKKISPEVTVVLTDGGIDCWGEGWQNTIWCILDNKGVTAPEGKTIHIESEG